MAMVKTAHVVLRDTYGPLRKPDPETSYCLAYAEGSFPMVLEVYVAFLVLTSPPRTSDDP